MLSVLTLLLFIGCLAAPHAQAAGLSGASFTNPTIVNDSLTNRQSGPFIVVSERGDALVVWQDARRGFEDVYSARSANGGLSFEKNVRVDDSTKLGSKQIRPSAVTFCRGIVYVVWQDNRRYQYDYDIYFSRSYNNGATFGSNVKIDDSNSTISWQECPAIAVSESGAIVVAWTDDRSGILRVMKATSINRGSSFSVSEDIDASRGTGNSQTGIALTAGGGMFFAAFMENEGGTPHPFISCSVDDGETFRSAVRLDTSGTPGSLQRNIDLAPMPGGGTMAVWEDNRKGDWDVFGRVIGPTGNPLDTDFQVSDGPKGTWQCHPSITSDSAGNVFVAWDDDRQGLADIRLGYKRFNGTGFEPSVVVAKGGSDAMLLNPTICMSTQPGVVYIAWSGDSLGTEDIYFSKGTITAISSTPLHSNPALLARDEELNAFTTP